MTDTTTDTISVLVAAYNAEKTLEASVQSILQQTHKRIEVIIVDDQSKDGTYALAQKIAATDDRVKVLSMPQNGGPARARNAALEIAKGDWIAVVDSDDLILPNRFEKMLDVAMSQLVDIVFDNLFYVTPHNGREELYIPAHKPVFGFLPIDMFIGSHRKSVEIPNLGFLKPLIRHNSIKSAHLRYEPDLKIGEDAMLIMDLMAMGARAFLLSDAYYRYHRHDGSISAVQKMDNLLAITNGYEAFLKKYDGRLDAKAVSTMKALISDNRYRLQVGIIVEDVLAGNVAPSIVKIASHPTYLFPVIKSLGGHIKRSLRRR